MARRGSADEGLAEIRRGVTAYQGLKTPPVFFPLLVRLEAEACGLARRPQEGLTLLQGISQIVTEGPGNALAADILLLAGDLLLAASPDDPAEAQNYFQRALELGLEFQTPAFELWAAMRLSKLGREQGKAEESRRLLNTAYAPPVTARPCSSSSRCLCLFKFL